MRIALAGLALVAVLLGGGAARAHQSAVKNFELTVDGGTVAVVVEAAPGDVAEAVWPGGPKDRIPDAGQIAARSGAVGALIGQWLTVSTANGACVPGAPTASVTADGRFVEVRWQAACDASAVLRLDFAGFFAVDRAHQALVRVGGGGYAFSAMVGAGDGPIEVTATPSFVGFVRTGIHHIFDGRDHISFVLALLLVVILVRDGERWQLRHVGAALRRTAGTITAFTIAHSLTLIAASLGWVALPSRLVEIMIAVSIAYTAIENIVRPDVRWRFALTFGFGLVHGLGFASVLADLLPPGDVVVPLLAFNVGVEIGQFAIVLVALPLFAALARLAGAARYRRVVMPALSSAIAVLGAIWIVERVFEVTILGL
ncbi:MAG: HupE/UreJ family protein [Deltaproteobacteria bacterium]|nr:HupE/UreJ family protein [Deltaproteobacteria bacterium]